MNRLFTVVIPTFNYGRFLRRAVDSVLAQAADDTELVVVDDGSIDDTPIIAAGYGPRITSLRQENRGVFAACRAGFQASAGRFLVFLDADDRLADGALDALRATLARVPSAGIVAGRHVTVTASGPRPSPPLVLGRSRAENFRRFLAGELDICTGAAAIRRDALERIVGHDGGLRVGMETCAVAHALWHHDAAAIDAILLEVYEHAGRLRDNLDEIGIAGDRLVDAVFDPRELPPSAFRWQQPFRSRLLRDRARSYHRVGRHAEAAAHFERAWQADPVGSIRDLRNLRRYLASRLRRGAAPAITVEPRPGREPGVVEVAHAAWLRGHRPALRADPFGFIGRCTALGDVVKLALERPTYLLCDPADIHHVFSGPGTEYRRTGIQAAFPGLFGRGLFARTGAQHIGFRRPVQPFLHRARLDAFVPPIRRTLAETLPTWDAGPIVDVSQGMQEFTLRVAARIILGTEDVADAAALFDDIQAAHLRAVRNRGTLWPLTDRLPTHRNRVLAAHVKRLHATVTRLIDGHRRQPTDESVLSRLVHLSDGTGRSYGDDDIRDHLLLIFLATYEPTATALAWMLELLARHPDEQRRVRDSLTGPTASDTAEPEAAAILQRPASMAFIHETLRLHPSVWMLARCTAEEIRLPSGVVVPRGVDVAVSIHHVHRDPRWYDEPDAFRPARFAGGTADLRAAGTYLPFGLGPAACLGEHLARLMFGMVLEAVLERYELAPGPGSVPRPASVNGFTSFPDKPVRLVIQRRHS